MRVDYDSWIASKIEPMRAQGLDASEIAPGDYLFPFARDLVAWALRRSCAAIFADTGLGKTRMQLDWARHVSRHGRVLILTPLAVAQQTVREARACGIDAEYRRQDDGSRIVVTNYDILDRFDPSRFHGIVLDESSILKSYDGATRTALIGAFSATPFRLACTATPAPNDHTELGNHSEFLGIKTRTEMLSEYFVHDGGSTQNWRLKGHAVAAFWRWVAGWGAIVRRPSDLGYPNDGFALPPLRMHERVLRVDHTEAWRSGALFATESMTLAEQRAVRRATLDRRVEAAAELAAGDEPALVWCELNDEGDAIERAISGAVQVRGSDAPDDKEDRLLGFADGRYRVLVTKPSIAGFGMNWQHCARQIFVGASHSYEQTYQAIRRCWRFGQRRPVDVFVIRAETDSAITANYRRKEADAARLADETAIHVLEAVRASVGAARREWNDYCPTAPMVIPSWLTSEST
jgi:superfamily II DNA or RNA helicase